MTTVGQQFLTRNSSYDLDINKIFCKRYVYQEREREREREGGERERGERERELLNIHIVLSYQIYLSEIANLHHGVLSP